MRARALILAFLALLMVAPAARRLARAEDEDDGDAKTVAGLSEDQVRRLRGKLRIRAGEWWRDREKLVIKCPQCKGAGKVRWRQGRRIVLVDCPKCDGHKIRVSDDLYRSCFYDMRTPAFRMQDGIKERLTEDYNKARSGNPFPPMVKDYRIKEVEIVDATHGIVHVIENKEPMARPQRWIWAEEERRGENWYLYEEGVDGAWPGSDDAQATPTPAVPAGGTEPPPAQPTPAQPPPAQPPSAQPAPTPKPPTPPPDAFPRATLEESQPLIKRWEEERNDLKARVIEIQLALDGVEGHEEMVNEAKTFLDEINGWIEESEEGYERARKDVEERGIGVRLEDRLHVNTLHIKSHRRLVVVEKMLTALVPGLGD